MNDIKIIVNTANEEQFAFHQWDTPEEPSSSVSVEQDGKCYRLILDGKRPRVEVSELRYNPLVNKEELDRLIAIVPLI